MKVGNHEDSSFLDTKSKFVFTYIKTKSCFIITNIMHDFIRKIKNWSKRIVGSPVSTRDKYQLEIRSIYNI